MKRLFKIITVTTLVFAMTTSMCFAATGVVGNKNIVPMIIDIEAIGGSGNTGIDFTINDQIDVTAKAGQCELIIGDLVVTNNATAGQLKIDSIEVKPDMEWTIKPDNSEYFANQKSGTKEFSLVCEDHDFSSQSKKEYGATKLVPANSGSQTFEFSGHIGVFRATYTDADLAEITVTVSIF